ncbi:MAG: hypothetical protein SV377_04465 [Halobacteria archaeon]|nr:hypothetical protein [Halobacteria archaeon]
MSAYGYARRGGPPFLLILFGAYYLYRIFSRGGQETQTDLLFNPVVMGLLLVAAIVILYLWLTAWRKGKEARSLLEEYETEDDNRPKRY